MPEWCTGISLLAHLAAIAMFCMAAVGFTFVLCVGVCIVCTYLCKSVCVSTCLDTEEGKLKFFEDIACS